MRERNLPFPPVPGKSLGGASKKSRGRCADLAFQAVVPSPSNTVIANQLLFQDVGAKAMLFTSEGFEILESLHDATKDSLRWIETPKYEDLVSKEKVEDFPFNHTFDEIKDVPFAALHTSGTTGHPKPIYWSHVAVAIHGTQMDPEIVPTDKELVMLQMFKGTRAFTHFPWYHVRTADSRCENTSFRCPQPWWRSANLKPPLLLRPEA